MIEGARRARSLDTNQLMLLLVALVVLIAPYTLLHPHHPPSTIAHASAGAARARFACSITE